MKKIIIGLVALLVVGGLASVLWPSVNNTGDLPFINYKDAFTQDLDEYFVYFYNTDCSFCRQLEPSIMEAHRAGVPIFVVDMMADDNSDAWYDWDSHHERFDVVVGELVDGEEVFADDFNEADYSPNDGWTFEVRGTDIVAVNNRAQNNTDPQSPEEIEVPGTPSMMHIRNGRSVTFDTGVDAAREMMSTYSGLSQPLFAE